jgi:ferredoxin-NADP reductase
MTDARQRGTSPELPTGKPFEVIVTAIRPAARDTKIYTLARADGSTLPASTPGAHIGVLFPNGLLRDYSLIAPEECPRDYTICVKRETSEGGGSSYLHSKISIGDSLLINPPKNNFPLNETAPYTILIAGGIGITPIYAMLTRLQAIGRDWELHYACQTRADAAFLFELESLANVHLHFDDESGGRFLPVVKIVANAAPQSHLYCCGPTPMLATFEAAAAAEKRPAEEIHIEYFKAKFDADLSGGFTVRLARSGQEFPVPPGKTILEVLRDAGISVVSSCEAGVCGACETILLEGTADHRDAILSEQERQDGKSMMICCSGAVSDFLVLDL